MAFVWIYRGQWPVHDRLREMPDRDAEKAVAEGWAQRVEGLEGREIKAFDNSPHADADAYYARITGARIAAPAKPSPEGEVPLTAPSGGVYGTRELRAAEPERRKPGRPKKDV